jgi:hypothetical protein
LIQVIAAQGIKNRAPRKATSLQFCLRSGAFIIRVLRIPELKPTTGAELVAQRLFTRHVLIEARVDQLAMRAMSFAEVKKLLGVEEFLKLREKL